MAGHDDEFEDRAAILRRRALFVVSAVAGFGVSGCGDEPATPPPNVCLSPIRVESAEPQPCLEIAPVPTSPADAGVAEPEDAAVDDGGPEDAGPEDASADAGPPPDAGPPRPQPCLKSAPPPGPCLRIAPRPCLVPPLPKK